MSKLAKIHILPAYVQLGKRQTKMAQPDSHYGQPVSVYREPRFVTPNSGHSTSTQHTGGGRREMERKREGEMEKDRTEKVREEEREREWGSGESERVRELEWERKRERRREKESESEGAERVREWGSESERGREKQRKWERKRVRERRDIPSAIVACESHDLKSYGDWSFETKAVLALKHWTWILRVYQNIQTCRFNGGEKGLRRFFC